MITTIDFLVHTYCDYIVNTLSGLASKKIVEIMNMQSNDLERYHRILVEMIEAKAKLETAEWFTNYLKGAISYRG